METETKKLYKSETNKIIAGICGGLGEYFNVDAVIFRILFIAMALMNGFGVLLYIILIFVIPKNPGSFGQVSENKADFGGKVKEAAENFKDEAIDFKERMVKDGSYFNQSRVILGLFIAIIGFILLISQFMPMPFFNWKIILSGVVILLGLYLIFKNSIKKI